MMLGMLIIAGNSNAQWLGISKTIGKSTLGDYNKMPGNGFGITAGYNRGFSVCTGYGQFESRHMVEKPNGTEHMVLREEYFRYQVGIGFGPNMDEFKDHFIKYFASILGGFISGNDKMSLYHEYPNGIITYGTDQNTGFYKARRSLVPIYSAQVGIYVAIPVGIFIGVDYIKPKKKDLFQFTDDHYEKHTASFLNTGGSNQYGPFNNTHGLYWQIGCRIGIN